MRHPDPVDPVPLPAATKEFARRWEANAGALSKAAGHRQRSPFRMVWEMSEAELIRHYGTYAEAAEGVFCVAVFTRKIRVWVESGPNWKRPTLFTIRSLLPPEGGLQGSGLYADQEELELVLGSRWPTAYPAVLLTSHASINGPRGALSPGADSGDNALPSIKRKPGPKPGPGYKPADVPTFESILKAQRESGNIHRQHALVRKFAGDPDHVFYERIKDRLRHGLPKWLAENDHEWFPAK